MIGGWLTINARRFAQAEAVAYADTRLSYETLNVRACRLAQGLASFGIRKGDRVAGLLHNCHQFVEAYFAAAKLGAIFVPMNFRLAAPEIGRLLDGCEAGALIHGEEFGEILAPLVQQGSFPRHRIVVPAAGSPASLPGGMDYESWTARFGATEPVEEVGSADDQVIAYTSGTTGIPKGAVLTHANTLFSSTTKIIDFELTRRDRIVVFGPLFHLGPLMDLAIPTLLRGGTLVLGRSRGFDPSELLAVLEKERATVVSLYPVMWRRLLAEADPARYDLTSLRLLLTGGEPMPLPVLAGIAKRFPSVPFINTYGSTEAGPAAVFLSPEHSLEKSGSIGKPAFGVDLRIVDDVGHEVPAGVAGEITIRSPFVCRGYWKQPEATAAAKRAGWWHTGDLGRKDEDGFVWIGGRKNDMIISGAENIYPVEIEHVLLGLNGVAEAAVVGVPDAEWGEAVAAFIVRVPGADVDEKKILEHCRANLAGYKKPRHIVFVDELPRTTVNKVSKETLRRRLR